MSKIRMKILTKGKQCLDALEQQAPEPGPAAVGMNPMTMAEKKEKWAQKAAKNIEKKGTEGEFTEYCGGDVTQTCVDKAARGSSSKRKKQAAFAANVNSHDDLKYPKKKGKNK